MSGRKGMTVKAYHKETSVKELSQQYSISRYAIQSRCGLRKKVELRHAAPLPKGRPKAHPESQKQIFKQLQVS